MVRELMITLFITVTTKVSECNDDDDVDDGDINDDEDDDEGGDDDDEDDDDDKSYLTEARDFR